MKSDMLNIKELDWVDVERGKYSEYDKRFVSMFKRSMDIKKHMQSYGTKKKKDNGRYDFVDHSHVSMLMNVDVDLDTVYSLPNMPADSDIKCPIDKDRLSDATVIAVDSSTIVFKNDKGEITATNIQYIADAINTFGCPTRVLCADDYPVWMEFGDITFLVAPKIDSGNGVWDCVSFDFKQWCPQLYGIKLNDIGIKQLMDLIYSLPKETTIGVLMDRISSLRTSKGNIQDTEEYF